MVLVSGFLEVALCEIYCQYAVGRADGRILSLVRKRLEDVNNPKVARILEVSGWFSDEWAKQLEATIQDRHAAAINGIMANRHKIAHGGSSDLSFARLRDWYKDALEVVEMIERQCGI